MVTNTNINQISHSKEDLLLLNNKPGLGSNWIKDINSLKDNIKYVLYPTGDAGLFGRLYMPLDINTKLTTEIIIKHNLWI